MISLIGFTGAGKSSLGRLLSLRYGLLVWDLDYFIACQEKMSISQIFSQKGELYFRDVEAAAIVSLSSSPGSSYAVLATGGGAVLREESSKYLSEHSFVVHVHATLDVIVQRLKKDITRPLLQGENFESTIKELYENRKGKYDFADLTVDSQNLEMAASHIVGYYLENDIKRLFFHK